MEQGARNKEQEAGAVAGATAEAGGTKEHIGVVNHDRKSDRFTCFSNLCVPDFFLTPLTF